MRKRYAILFATIILAFVAGLAWRLSLPREPTYQGRPLSYWLEGYSTADISETSQQSADTAMREIGTNAIPTPLRMLQEDDSHLKLKFFSVVEKQHFIKIHHLPASEINYRGMKGFQILGANAKGAVPALIKIYEAEDSRASGGFAAVSLGAIGPSAKEAIPVLLKRMSRTNILDRVLTMQVLGMIHSEPEITVPVLIKHLNDNVYMGGHRYTPTAIEALGHFGTNALEAVPALIQMLDDADPTLRNRIISALQEIDPQAAANLRTNSP